MVMVVHGCAADFDTAVCAGHVAFKIQCVCAKVAEVPDVACQLHASRMMGTDQLLLLNALPG